MIKKLFLPEKFGSRRIIAQRIVGLALHDDCVRASLVHSKQHKTILEKLYTEPIEQGPPETASDRISYAIKQCLSAFKAYDQVRVCIPASVVVFKDVVLQIIDPEKIRMVLDYEIESMLPFSINEATTDFIITKTQKDPQQAHILVAAIRNQDLQQNLSLYTDAGVEPTAITIDLFALYGLYQQIPEYNNLPQGTALLDIGPNATRIAFIDNGQLRLARYIQRGIATIIKLAIADVGGDIKATEVRLYKFGIRNLGDDEPARSIQKHLVLLFNDIQFTLNSFSLKLNFYDGVSRILCSGVTTAIPDFTTFCSDTMQIPAEIFDCTKLFNNSTIKNKFGQTPVVWSDFTNALGVAIPSLSQSDFDLRRKKFALQRNTLVIQQLITATLLILTILIVLSIRAYFDLGSLQNTATRLEQQEIAKLKAEGVFPKDKFPKKLLLPIVVKEAEKIVREKLEIWAPFAQQRMKPLEMWLETTRIISKKQFDVTIKEIIFTTEEKGWERDKDGVVKKDFGVPKVEVDGLFKSKTGSHFADFKTLEDRFKDSTVLKLLEPQTEQTPALGDGVNFIIRMRLKEE